MKVTEVTKPASQVSPLLQIRSHPCKDCMDVTRVANLALIQHQSPHGAEPSSVSMWNQLPDLPEPGDQANLCDQVRRV